MLLGDPERLERARRTLGSLSSFMKHLKQPIARRANEESGTSGHLWDQRFYSGALLSEEGARRCDGVRGSEPGGAPASPSGSRSAGTRRSRSGSRRNSAEALEEYLAPLVSGLGEDEPALPHPTVTLGDYVDMVRGMADAVNGAGATSSPMLRSGWRESPCSASGSARTGPRSAWQAGSSSAGSS